MRIFFLLLLILSFTGCSGNLSLQSSISTSSTTTVETSSNDNQLNTRFSFYYNDYYSLSSPDPNTSCAGDIHTFYDAIALTNTSLPLGVSNPPLKLATSSLDFSTTILPGFINNVSVDLSDANVNNGVNRAINCSYSNTNSLPASNCATFDYGSVAGLNSILTNSFFILGGLNQTNTNGFSANCNTTSLCQNSFYALGINVLPSSAAGSTQAPGLAFKQTQQSISSWFNLSGNSNYSGPPNTAGGTLSYNPSLQNLLLFSGGASTYNSDTWIFNIPTLQWTQLINYTPQVNSALTTQLDSTSSTPNSIAKNNLGRAFFGMVAAPGMAISGYATNSDQTFTVDTTDRIILVGGYCGGGSSSIAACTDVRSFNPTYGPEYNSASVPQNPLSTPLSSDPTQWIDVYPSKILSNANTQSQYLPTYVSQTSSYTGFVTPSPTPSEANWVDSAVSFGIVVLNNLSTTGRQYTTSNPITSGSSYLLVAGGFHATFSGDTPVNNVPNPTFTGCTTLSCGGNMELAIRWPAANPAPPIQSETYASNFSAIANFPSGAENTPLQWIPIPNTSTGSSTYVSVPWFGGVSMLKGFPQYLNTYVNDVIYFGGADCPNYRSSSATCQWPNTISNPGAYWNFPNSSGGSGSGNGTNAYNIITGYPINAGMASARGTETNTLIVAWGGMVQAGTPDSSQTVYYLYNGSQQRPTTSLSWQKTKPTATTYPAGVSDATLTFSHVTQSFYLFGGSLGDQNSQAISNQLWQLTPSCNSTTSTCTFTWTQLTPTCYPTTCPQGRYGHGMVEANYNYFNAPEEPSCSSSFQPCSFGLFMMGGTLDGVTPLTDRWMFDPTVNHWQLMPDLAPRILAASSNLDYTTQSQNAFHGTLMFGGETGLANTSTLSTMFFVPPTLGDTWFYDYSNNSWNLVQLFVPTASPASIAPPPISAGLMVTRTQNVITPEVYLFGGRTKDGMLQPISQVYKFCMGSAGENSSYQCSAPNTTLSNNTYFGTWINKTATITTPAYSFQGAATYDSIHDLILLYGGTTSTSKNSIAITALTELTLDSTGTIYEYTPPTSTNSNGMWTPVPACSQTSLPSGRYGHGLYFNSTNNYAIIVGGYDGNGQLLTQQTSNSTTPDIWIAKRSMNGANPCYQWTPITVFGNLPSSQPNTGLANMVGTFVPSQNYNTGYYTSNDTACNAVGLISSSNTQINKILAGGVYIDLDRAQLGATENIILNLTFYPLGVNNLRGDFTNLLTPQESSYFRIHLIHTGLSGTTLRSATQPRYFYYAPSSSTNTTTTILDTLHILTPPTGQIHQEQIYIPLSANSEIDRIRIERFSGNAILIDATIFRLGHN